MGMATSMAMMDVRNVPQTSGQIPKCFSANRGVHWVSKKNFSGETSRKKPTVSKIKTYIMPAVVKIDRLAQRNRRMCIIFSPMRGGRRGRGMAGAPGGGPPFLDLAGLPSGLVLTPSTLLALAE